MTPSRHLLPRLLGLRARLTIGMLLIAFVACISFAIVIYQFVDMLQDTLHFDTLDRELSSLVIDYQHGVPISGRRGDSAWVFVSRAPGHDASLPAALRHLPDNDHTVVDYKGQEYYSSRRDVNGTAIFLMLNVQDVVRFKHHLVMIALATLSLVIVLSLLIAIGFSYLILRPVRHLAERLSNHEPGRPNPAIAADYGDPDMRNIAASFDTLIGRFDVVLAREKAFTEDASHELRTPLAAALSASELLHDMPELDERARDRVQRVQHACERMHRLVTALLFLARDDRVLGNERCDAAAVLDDVLIYQRDAMIANRIELTVDAQPTLLALPEGVVYSMLHNLIDNAVRHTIDGSLRVQVTPGRIAVVDTGEGLSAKTLAHIFERRYRTANSPGLGIGLYLVSRICERQGWRLETTSEPGVGTRIEIALKP